METSLIKQTLHKDTIPMAVAQITTAVDNGDISALEALTKLKLFEAICASAKKQIIEQGISEREKYGKEIVNRYGYEVSIMEAGTSYDYSQCGDIEWERTNSIIESEKARLKDREAVLKALKEPMTLVNEETGETYKVYPPVKKSTTTLKFS